MSLKSAFIIGSTSTVAITMLQALAQKGCKRFHLVARDPGRNQDLADSLQSRWNVEITTETCDLLQCTDINSPYLPKLTEDFDLYLVTAGYLGDAELARTDPAEALAITAANYSGLIPWLTAIASPERIEKPGRLWVFSSVAGDRGRPSNYHYGAAKAALTTFCEGLYLRCHGKPFAVRIIKAGFIATPMTIGKAPAKLCVSPEFVARTLLKNPNRRGIEYLPWFWSLIMSMVRALPAVLATKL